VSGRNVCSCFAGTLRQSFGMKERMDTLDALQQVELFAHLSPGARHALASVAHVRRYDDGQVIMLEGDSDVPVLYVLRGVVRVFRASLEGREQTVIRLGPGGGFNMPAAFVATDGAPASAIAVGPVALLSIPRTDFRRITSETPEVALAVLRDLAAKLHYLTDLTRDLGLLTVRTRLARFLLSAYTSSSMDKQRHPLSSPPVRWTHREIAAQIGTVREVVSRTMRTFVKDGLIKLDRHRIVILDREALVREAGL
jgi:CRP/FNR family transcriptional regulator